MTMTRIIFCLLMCVYVVNATTFTITTDKNSNGCTVSVDSDGNDIFQEIADIQQIALQIVRVTIGRVSCEMVSPVNWASTNARLMCHIHV